MTDQEPHSTSKNGRRRLWILGALMLLLCSGYVLWIWLTNGNEQDTKLWMAERRAKGERFTIEELFPDGFGDPSTNRAMDLYGIFDSLSEQPLWFGGDSMNELGDGVARPFWADAVPHKIDSKVTNEWALLYSAADVDRSKLEDLYRLLPQPDQDMGDVLHVVGSGSSGLSAVDFVRMRSLAQYLSGAVTIELKRGNIDAAKAAMSGLMDLPGWNWRHADLAWHMIGVRIRSLGVSAQWSVLQHQGWTDTDLLGWQRRWETNGCLSLTELVANVSRAQALEAYDVAATNTAGMQGVIMNWGSAGDRIQEIAWSTFLSDRDKMYSLRVHQVVIDAIRTGIAERSRVAHRKVYAKQARLESELNRGLARYCILAGLFIYKWDGVADTIFEYESRREMLVTAIALRRYQRAHGSFPNTLKELIPEYLKEEPVDWMNGGGLHYEQGKRGWFELRSLGENARDDRGAGDDLPWWQTPERKAGHKGVD